MSVCLPDNWPADQKFSVILADPPWPYKSRGTNAPAGRAERHYPLMSMTELINLPVRELADPAGCALMLWTTAPMMREALQLMKAWGFQYKTIAFTWAKTIKGAKEGPSDNLNGIFSGTRGYYTRPNAEFVLVGTKKRAPKRLSATVKQIIVSRATGHSRKPEEAHRRIEQLYAGPYLELFARPPIREGWTVWGNEV